MDAETLNGEAGRAPAEPETAGKIGPPADNIPLNEQKVFIVQFKTDASLEPKLAQVSTISHSPEEAAMHVRNTLVGRVFNGKVIEFINVYAAYPAPIPALVA
jgi:hypothetical protein